MAQIVPKKLGQSAIGTSISTLYTVPTSVTTFLKDIEICNTSSTLSTQVTVYLVPSGDSEAVANELIPSTLILPKGMFQWTGAIVMDTGDFIRIIATVAGSTIYASGGEYQ